MIDQLEVLVIESRYSSDSKRNNELVKLLKTQDSSIVYSVVRRLMDLNCPNHFVIARRALNDKKYIKEHFRRGLDVADKSSIQTWIAITLPKLGARETFKILLEKESERPGIVDDALYFLPRMIMPTDRDRLAQLKDRQLLD